MKKYFFILAAAIGFAACSDNSSNGSGTSIDSASMAPTEAAPQDNTNPSDNTMPPNGNAPDSTTMNDSGSSGSPNSQTPSTDQNQSR